MQDINALIVTLFITSDVKFTFFETWLTQVCVHAKIQLLTVNPQMADYSSDLILVALMQKRPDHDYISASVLTRSRSCFDTYLFFTFLCVLLKRTKREERKKKGLFK